MKVRAIARGFYNGRRNAGDVFEVPDGAKAKWWAPVVKPAPAPVENTPAPRTKKAGKKEPEPVVEADQGNDDLV